MKANQSSMRCFWIDLTKSEGLARYFQLRGLARVDTSVRRYIAWRENGSICLTVVIL